jgi:hypothetical protein
MNERVDDPPPATPDEGTDTGAAVNQLAMTTLPHDTLLTRADVAREIGKHVSTVRRLEQKSVLTPVVGRDGVHRFRHDQVRELVEVRERVRSGPAAPDAYDGSTAAAVFELFAQGVEPVDVVVRMKLHPLAVEAIHRK